MVGAGAVREAGRRAVGGAGGRGDPGPARRDAVRAFWRAVPPVSLDLAGRPGLRLAVGIGEAPVGLQGTFSLWETGRR